MNGTVEAQILDAEDRLRTAMLNSDLAALDELLAPELIFTNNLGHLLGKEDDLVAYRSGMLKVKDLRPSEQRVRHHGDRGYRYICGYSCQARITTSQRMATF